MAKNNKSNLSLWALVLWNIFIFAGVTFIFIKLLIKKIAGDFPSIEENIILIALPIFLLVNSKAVIKNIMRLYFSYKNDQINDEIKENFIENRKEFFNMYRKVSYRRMFTVLIFPMASIIIVIFSIPIFSNGNVSWEQILNSWQTIFSHIPIWTLLCLIVPSVLLFIKIYISMERNTNMLFRVYEFATDKEIKTLDSISEKQVGYVFTRDFLINWDGNLNIIPLKEIKKLQYINYFYLFLYGTRLKIISDKKYTLWHYGPSESEWIKRGILPQNDNLEKQIYMDVNIPY